MVKNIRAGGKFRFGTFRRLVEREGGCSIIDSEGLHETILCSREECGHGRQPMNGNTFQCATERDLPPERRHLIFYCSTCAIPEQSGHVLLPSGGMSRAEFLRMLHNTFDDSLLQVPLAETVSTDGQGYDTAANNIFEAASQLLSGAEGTSQTGTVTGIRKRRKRRKTSISPSIRRRPHLYHYRGTATQKVKEIPR